MRLRMAAIFLIAIANCSAIVAQPAEDSRELRRDIAVERDLAGSQTHRYVITLASGEYAHVTFEQDGIDLIALMTGGPRENRSSRWIGPKACGEPNAFR